MSRSEHTLLPNKILEPTPESIASLRGLFRGDAVQHSRYVPMSLTRRTFMEKQVLVLSVLTLAGCAPMLQVSTPRMQVSTPRTVMLSDVYQFNAVKALQMAEAECAKHNRHAVAVPDNIRDGQQSYECKD